MFSFLCDCSMENTELNQVPAMWSSPQEVPANKEQQQAKAFFMMCKHDKNLRSLWGSLILKT